eukprot:Nk52_evm20s296 gene=Nk52_evmTU20s296
MSSVVGSENSSGVVKAGCETMEQLVEQLYEAFDNEEGADIDHVIQLMESYTSSDNKDWKKYALLDPYKYTRNLVDEGNGKFNLMILAWNCGQASSIHDHAGSHCCMKVLDGSVDETLYCCPEKDVIAEEEEGGIAPMVVKGNRGLYKNQVAYIHDRIGLHRVSNPDHARPAFTLHLYSPPYEQCHRFDEATGKAYTTPKITFFSRHGKRVKMGSKEDFSV